ncbi:MAG: chromosome segregation protein SMC, partial [Actinobacteria bacterium]|nr:chromosome segregation protein SMC [Actinomycetota bacterium]
AAVIQADVRDAKLRILADDLIAFNSTLSLEVADETALRQRRDEVDQELDQLRKREIELDQIAAIQGPELAQAQNNYYSLTAQKEKLRGIQNLASERARFLAEEADEARASGRDPEVLETEAKVLRGEQSILQGSSDKASAELAAASNSVNQLEVRLKGEEDRVAAAQRALADYREGTARQEGHIKSLQSRIDGAGSEINRLESALAGARTRVAESKVEFARLESEIAGLDAGELGLDAEFERAKALLNGSKANLEKLRSDLWLAERAKAAAEAKIDALRQATLHKDGSGALLTNNQGIQIRGSLASLLTIEPGWQSAVTSALGSLADALVLQDLSQVISAISFLKSTSAGSAELLFFSEADSSAVIEIPNGLTPLASKVSSATLNSMLPALFSGFVVADSLSQANQIISGSSSLIAVTKDGDLVGSGRARGGSSARTTLIEISEIIERGEIELQKHSHDCDRIHFDLSTAETKLTSDQLNYDQVLARLNESDAAMAALAEQMAAASQGVKSASGEVERLEKSIVEVKQALNIDLDELVIAKSEFEKSSEPSEPELSSLENLRATLATARAVEVEARLALRTIEERVAAISQRAKDLELATSSVHRDEIARAEQRLRIEQLEIKAMEEFGVDSSSLINEYAPDKPVPTFIEDDAGNLSQGEFIPYIRAEQEKRLAGAEKSLALLGKINPLALEEFSSLEERLKYLADQLEDLKKSKKDLLDIIKSVDDKVQEIFEEAFRDTAREFEKIFARLFPGGEGRLLLTDPRDLLNSGVDVEARPPGKRIKRLSLLSGGERSLTAVALLVAIFKARPSPFYVLDEVEAALDDTNLGRLLSVLEELRQASQLIIITHQKRTMEIGDTLYGVSMRGDGVSEVISQRLREIETEPA